MNATQKQEQKAYASDDTKSSSEWHWMCEAFYNNNYCYNGTQWLTHTVSNMPHALQTIVWIERRMPWLDVNVKRRFSSIMCLCVFRFAATAVVMQNALFAMSLFYMVLQLWHTFHCYKWRKWNGNEIKSRNNQHFTRIAHTYMHAHPFTPHHLRMWFIFRR